MRNVIQDEVAVGSDQAGELHVLVVDAEIESFADQAFDDLDHRALAQIVGAFLETEAEHADTRISLLHDHLEAASNLIFVARQNRSQNRKLQIVGLRAISKSAQIFREARTAK